MDEQLVASIEELGLSEKEARVYVACLILGPSGVQKIADQADIKRVTTYVILESLINLGLVSQSIKAKKALFVAESPSSLRRLLDNKERSLREQKKHFEAILPELRTLQSLATDSPSVKFYDTAEGIRAIMASFLSEQRSQKIDTVYGITNLDQLYAFFPSFKEQRANPDRVKTKIKSRMIYTSVEGPLFKESDDVRNRESRFVPVDKYPLNGDLTIVGDTVVMLSLGGQKPIGVTIHSAELAKSMQAIYELAWEAASHYDQK